MQGGKNPQQCGGGGAVNKPREQMDAIFNQLKCGEQRAAVVRPGQFARRSNQSYGESAQRQ